jgi:hypothetical protein
VPPEDANRIGILGRRRGASRIRTVPATFVSKSASGLAFAVLATVAQARWKTPAHPSGAARQDATDCNEI